MTIQASWMESAPLGSGVTYIEVHCGRRYAGSTPNLAPVFPEKTPVTFSGAEP
jgi:hypothetical protein